MSLSRAIGLLCLTLLAIDTLLPPHYKGKLATFGIVHHTAHIAVFCLLYLLITAGSRTARHSAAVLLFLLAFGAALEMVQSRVYGTLLEVADISANASGTLLGFCIDSARRTSSKSQ